MFVRSRNFLLTTTVFVALLALLPFSRRAAAGRGKYAADGAERRTRREKEALVAMYWLGAANVAYTILVSGQLEGLSGFGLMLGAKLVYERMPHVDELGVERPFGVGVSRRKVDPSFSGWDLLLPTEGMAQMTGKWLRQARKLGIDGTLVKLASPVHRPIGWATGRFRLLKSAWKGRRALHP